MFLTANSPSHAGRNRASNLFWPIGVFLVLLFAGLLLYQFVHQATTTISEALAEEVLEQQQDVADLLHLYSATSLALSEYQRSITTSKRDHVLQSLKDVSEQLEKMRSNYSFERLDGAAQAHAYAKPVLEDVNQWMTDGIDYYDTDSEFILELAAGRLRDRQDDLRKIASETDDIAQALISQQRQEIGNFRDSLLMLLASFSVLLFVIISLLVRQRNMQIHIGQEQQNRSEAIIEAESRGRRKAEIALSESENILRKIIDAIPENIAMIDSKGIIAAANEQWRQFVGTNNPAHKDGGIGASFDQVYPSLVDADIDGAPHVLERIHSVRKNGTELRSDEFLLGHSESRQWIEISALPFISDGARHTLLIHENVTDRKLLEERDRKLRADMAHVSRLTTAGEFATGMAHELNQPLTAISHNCHAALTSVKAEKPHDHELIETLDDIYRLAQRAGDIIRSMRRFTKKETGIRVSTDINQLIVETIRLTQPEAREAGVVVELVLLESTIHVEIDPVQIQQVLVNLERNSVEAMSHSLSPIKRLSISTELNGSNQLRVSVADTGPGLSPEIQERIFSTFQTSKSDGMGLGLAISRSIVESHGGKLWVDTNPDIGVTFRFTLPILFERH